MMKNPFSKTDAYTIKARIYPFLLTAFPLAAATMVWLQNEFACLPAVWGLLVWCGGTALFAQIGRDMGKFKQPQLYSLWGGEPTTRMLRHRTTTNKVILARWHSKIQKLCPDLKIPSESEEILDPQSADYVYEAGVSVLREKTRDKKKFGLVFDELCSYGFRRNLWGMRPIGIVISVLGTSAILAYTGIDILNKTEISKTSVIAAAINLAILSGWLFLFTTSWVKLAADAYALRVLESSERL